MGKDPAFLFYPGDYLRDTQCLSPAAQVAYDRIMCEHMRNICISQAQLKFFTKRLTDDERDELMMILKSVNDGFQIEWVVESICKRKDYSESRRKNRSAKSKLHMSHISSTYVQHMENENENENEDVIEKGIALVEKKQTAIAPRNVPHDEFHAYFTELGYPQEADKFIDYYSSNGWKVGRNAMKDWKATARRWVRRNHDVQADKRLVRDTKMSDAQRNIDNFVELMNQNKTNDTHD